VDVLAAVIFDFDGLILDTELPVFRAWSEAYERVGVAPLTVEEWSVQLGTHGKLDPLAELATRAAARDAPMDATALAVVAERRLQRRDQLLSVETLRPGVEAWIDAASRRGLAAAVASSSARPWVEGHLARLGVLDRFVAIACWGDRDGVDPKPSPDLYVEVCTLLGAAPAEAIAVEDSPNGVRAAKAAGLACVAVPNDLTRFLALDEADLVVSSLADVTLDEALRMLGR
jgi:HAD superfamily hydrolase (TIGR01509 family)